MNPENDKKADAMKEVAEDLPFVSIIIPFEPKMNMKPGFDSVVKAAFTKTENELLKNYPENVAAPVIKKLQHTLDGLNHTMHHKKSIGIFISPSIEKVYYFNHYTPPEDHLYTQAL